MESRIKYFEFFDQWATDEVVEGHARIVNLPESPKVPVPMRRFESPLGEFVKAYVELKQQDGKSTFRQLLSLDTSAVDRGFILRKMEAIMNQITLVWFD